MIKLIGKGTFGVVNEYLIEGETLVGKIQEFQV